MSDIPLLLTEIKDKNLITDEEYTLILKNYQTQTNDVLLSILNCDCLNDEAIVELISQKYNIPLINLKNSEFNQKLIQEIPAKYTHHYDFIPVQSDDDCLEIAYHNPFDMDFKDEIQTLFGKRVLIHIATKKDIRDSLKKVYGIGADTVEQMIDEVHENEDIDLIIDTDKNIEDLDQDASIIKFVNQVISEAIKERSTDIHIEPYENQLKIRYRIDGVLYDAPFPTEIIHFHNPIISRLKIMSQLNISERRLPQDGRFKVKLKNTELDLRISILPTPWGEAASIRILSGAGQFLELKDLGFTDDDLQTVQQSISKPYGMILVTGPTGSGKTTSLYASLNRLNTRDRKIITIEDPIEYLIDNITQLQINSNIDFSFAKGLRSMLRHDPDIMMVGEIRDRETAEIAIQAALTGHLVFSTLHTNDAASTITRMTDIGIEHFLLASSLQCVIAQRLVRVLCEECKIKSEFTPQVLKRISDYQFDAEYHYEARGCSRCNFTGFYGRTGIYEIISVDKNLREMIQQKPNTEDIRKYAMSRSTHALRYSGFKKVNQGITSLEEVFRVTADHF